MKVKLLTSMAGADFSHEAGAVVDLPDDEAKRFLAAGLAEPATGVSTASVAAPRTAAKKKATPRNKATKKS